MKALPVIGHDPQSANMSTAQTAKRQDPAQDLERLVQARCSGGREEHQPVEVVDYCLQAFKAFVSILSVCWSDFQILISLDNFT